MIYLTEPVDEYCVQALPEFDGKRFQNVAKEGVKFDESDKAKEKREALEKEFEPLTTWLKDKALKDKVKGQVICKISTDVLEVWLHFLGCVDSINRLRKQCCLRG